MDSNEQAVKQIFLERDERENTIAYDPICRGNQNQEARKRSFLMKAIQSNGLSLCEGIIFDMIC